MPTVHITLKPKARAAAAEALKRSTGVAMADKFDGPIFVDAANWGTCPHYVAVYTRDGFSYRYPHRDVARIKVEE